MQEDKLDTIFALQTTLNEDIVRNRHLELSYEEWMHKNILATMVELTELLNELNYKWWKNPKPIDQAAVQEELVDVLHFFVSMCLRSGMTAEDLYRGYIAKNQENFDRQYGRSKKKGYEVEALGTEFQGE